MGLLKRAATVIHSKKHNTNKSRTPRVTEIDEGEETVVDESIASPPTAPVKVSALREVDAKELKFAPAGTKPSSRIINPQLNFDKDRRSIRSICSIQTPHDKEQLSRASSRKRGHSMYGATLPWNSIHEGENGSIRSKSSISVNSRRLPSGFKQALKSDVIVIEEASGPSNPIIVIAPPDDDDPSQMDGFTATNGEENVDNASTIVEKEPIPQPAKERSHAASLAANAMDPAVPDPTEASIKPLNKLITQLTLHDVQVSESELKEDIRRIWRAMHLFMNSRFKEAEEICLTGSDHRLYYSLGYSLLQTIKSMATFEPEDLAFAIESCKQTLHISNLLRKKDASIFESGMRFARGSTTVHSIKHMNVVQQHAELIYAECSLLKALLGIVYSGDFLTFIKEALTLRSAHASYRILAKFIEESDEHSGGRDPKIDNDFRSGVCLGNGMMSLTLSLVPGQVLKIMEVFGYSGNRDEALQTLMMPGGWKEGVSEPGTPVEQEGLRRQVCDLALMSYHLVIQSYVPVKVDIPTAANILHFNSERYPNGIFLLYFEGRYAGLQTLYKEAKANYHQAIESQKEFARLADMCYWDLGIISFATSMWNDGFEYFDRLEKESNWSKSFYAYCKAVCLLAQNTKAETVDQLMASVPTQVQKIAGKSLPIEKFVVRRSKKYFQQDKNIFLAGEELTYILNGLPLCPAHKLRNVTLVFIEQSLKGLKQDSAHYIDDYCLGNFLEGVVLRLLSFPDKVVILDTPISSDVEEEGFKHAKECFENVLAKSREIVYDHHLIWFTHYELGRLYECHKQYKEAEEQYKLILSGKISKEESRHKGGGKASLQNMILLKSSSSLTAMKEAGYV